MVASATVTNNIGGVNTDVSEYTTAVDRLYSESYSWPHIPSQVQTFPLLVRTASSTTKVHDLHEIPFVDPVRFDLLLLSTRMYS